MIIIPLSLKIAFRLSRGKQNIIVSLISIISILGIALGVTVLLVSLSTMNGFERELNNRILAIVPHAEIEPINLSFNDWPKLLKRIKKIPGITAATPYLNFTSLIECNNKLQAIQIKGIDPLLESRLNTLMHYANNDVWSRFQVRSQQIIIGKVIADNLQVKPGDWLTIMIINNKYKTKMLKPQRFRLQVSGILDFNSQLNRSFAIVPLVEAQNYLQRDKDVDGIAIKVNDIFNVNKIVYNIGIITNNCVKIRSWINTYGYIYHDIQMIRTIMYLGIILIIIIACFSIISTLVIVIRDKSTDIAVLRTIGARDILIHTIFVWYGFLVGLTGIVIGIILGLLISLNLTKLSKKLEHVFNYQLLPSNVYFIDFLPTELQYIDIIYVTITAFFLSLVVSWYSARCASRINLVKILSRQ